MGPTTPSGEAPPLAFEAAAEPAAEAEVAGLAWLGLGLLGVLTAGERLLAECLHGRFGNLARSLERYTSSRPAIRRQILPRRAGACPHRGRTERESALLWSEATPSYGVRGLSPR